MAGALTTSSRNYLSALAGTTRRVKIDVAGETYEGRTLYNVFISAPENMAKVEEIRRAIERLGSAELSAAAVDSIARDVPAIAWLGYSIHGDEVSGMDAAIQLIYQLAAGTDPADPRIFWKTSSSIINPSENPDGRERYLSMLQTYRSSVPNWDRFAMQHSGVWPWGRTNHYLFDLNRDWILVRQTETASRVATLAHWNPQLVVDGHEMEANATFLFSTAPRADQRQHPGTLYEVGRRVRRGSGAGI